MKEILWRRERVFAEVSQKAQSDDMIPENPFEKPTRLSESPLWKLQHAFYCYQGAEAWRQGIVPSYATSNPYIAKQYAQLVVGYLRQNLLEESLVDLTEPFYIFDLGAGSGQCAYLFLKELLKMMSGTDLQRLRLRYVMTDITEKNLLYLVKHPFLKPYFKSGILDVAYYEHTFQEQPLHLFFSKVPVETLVNPIVLLCNYFFDTLPQDLFRGNQGVLEEGRIQLVVDQNSPIKDFNDPRIIPHLSVNFYYRPVLEGEIFYPDFPELNSLLKEYQERLKNQFFLMPIGGLQALRYFGRLSKNRMLVLVGDHGPCHWDQLEHQSEVLMTRHGNFSMTVNFHFLSRYFNQLGGVSFLPKSPDSFFVTAAFLVGSSQDSEIAFAFKESVDKFQMRDYWKLVSHAKDKWQNPNLEQIFLLMKLGNWDPLPFQLFMDAIRLQAAEASEQEKEKLSQVIDCLWDHFYPTNEEQGLFANTLGELLFSLKKYARAIHYYENSLSITGFRAATYGKMGEAYLALEDKTSAWSCYQLAKQGLEDG